MIELLKSIWDAILLAITLVGEVIQTIIDFILMIPDYVSYLLSLITVIPPFATVFFIGGISLTVMLFVMNRTE